MIHLKGQNKERNSETLLLHPLVHSYVAWHRQDTHNLYSNAYVEEGSQKKKQFKTHEKMIKIKHRIIQKSTCTSRDYH